MANLWLASHSFGLFVEITSVDKGSEALGGYPILLLGAPMGGVLETCQENRLITCLGPTLLNWKMRRLNGASPRSNVHINILDLPAPAERDVIVARLGGRVVSVLCATCSSLGDVVLGWTQ